MTWPWFKTTGIPFWDRCTTHFRTYFSGDRDVHWGYKIVTLGQKCLERFLWLSCILRFGRVVLFVFVFARNPRFRQGFDRRGAGASKLAAWTDALTFFVSMCWSIVTGPNRESINLISELKRGHLSGYVFFFF